ncbi:MAG TPA: type II toxin-antitoxin system VapC family toxin [Vicinamibacterales bacterium]|nr:type II toxin-antitoxin system VapC family toxin [Vicinamibacterales bacterium]
MVEAPSGFLLDTNVISELMKRRPNRRVVDWIDATPEELLYLSVITIGEIRKGIDLLDDDDSKRGALQSWLDRDLRVRFFGRWLAFDDGVAERWGQVEALAKKRRRTLPTIDAQLAATALHHGLTFATRNTADLRNTGVPVFNPWGDRGE